MGRLHAAYSITSLHLELHEWVDAGKTEGGKPTAKSAASHAALVPVTPDHMPSCADEPRHSSFPGANKDPFQDGPYCDHAEQKQSVPLRCSLWSGPAFVLHKRPDRFCFFDSFIYFFFLDLSVLKRALKQQWTITSTVCGGVETHGFWPLKKTVNHKNYSRIIGERKYRVADVNWVLFVKVLFTVFKCI